MSDENALRSLIGGTRPLMLAAAMALTLSAATFEQALSPSFLTAMEEGGSFPLSFAPWAKARALGLPGKNGHGVVLFS